MSDDKTGPGTRFSELSSEAVFALYYALAEVPPLAVSGPPVPIPQERWVETFRQMQVAAREMAAKMGKKVLSLQESKAAITVGLRELGERELIGLARDEMGGHRPVAVYLDRLVMDGDSGLILSERN